MIPNVFVSSTIQDLFHLREAIMEAIKELSYNPVLSEYGSVGYLPMVNTEQSCYISIQDCQLAVLIVGKRYGNLSGNGLSITHNEFIKAKEKGIPLITLVDEEVLTFKRVYDLNDKRLPPKGFPAMDQPDKTFKFIQEINDSEVNNGILAYKSVAEAQSYLKEQLAHLFGELLRNRFDPIKSDVKDVLSEIKTLRYELVKKQATRSLPLLKGIRFIVSDKARRYKDLIEHTCESIESVAPLLIKAKTFKGFIESIKVDIIINEDINFSTADNFGKPFAVCTAIPIREQLASSRKNLVKYAIYPDKKVIMNNSAEKDFEWMHKQLLWTVNRGK